MSKSKSPCGCGSSAAVTFTPVVSGVVSDGSFKRNNYFTGKLLVERDFTDEQKYYINKMRLHNRMLHGCGIVCGLQVVPHENPECRSKYIAVEPGFAVDSMGREIIVSQREYISLLDYPEIALLTESDTRHKIQVFICYRECPTEDIPVFFDKCGCDTTGTAANRVLESYTFKLAVDPVLETEEIPADETESECCKRVLSKLDTCDDCPCGECVSLAIITNYTYGNPVEGSNIHLSTNYHRLLPTRIIAQLLDCIKGGDAGEPGSGITSVTISTLPCDQAATVSFDPGTGVLALGIPKGCDGEDGISPPSVDELENNLTHIDRISWEHASSNSGVVNIDTLDGTIAQGLVVEFSQQIKMDLTSAAQAMYGLHVYRVLYTESMTGVFVQWTQIPAKVIPVEVHTSGSVVTAYKQINSSNPKAAGIVLSDRTLKQILERAGTVRIEINGDHIIDANGKAVDANFPRATFPTGDRSDIKKGLQGGMFISWFDIDKQKIIDLNNDAISSLETLPFVGRATANRIVENRPIRKKEDLLNIDGITPRAYNAIRDRVKL